MKHVIIKRRARVLTKKQNNAGVDEEQINEKSYSEEIELLVL